MPSPDALRGRSESDVRAEVVAEVVAALHDWHRALAAGTFDGPVNAAAFVERRFGRNESSG